MFPLAQVNLGNDRIILVWPAFTPEGHFIDNNAWAITFRVGRGGAGIKEKHKISGIIGVQEYLDKENTRWDYIIQKRYAGLPLNESGPKCQKYSMAFVNHLFSEEYEEAVQAATLFARLFEFNDINNTMTNILIKSVEVGPLDVHSVGEVW